ncbi:MAG: D-alanine--D-alanine ligase [Eubacteriales bacterium]|nr:D-alanine--D-alanine ligase [Eubacteriales bacterium]
MKIVVLGGGISTERHVSLVTATSVCKALRSLGHKAIFVDIFLGLEKYTGELENAFDAPDGFCGNVAIEHTAPNLDAVIASRELKSASRLGKNVLEICQLADCVFLGLHGADGEDGKIQAALDLLGVPYTGSGPLGSAMAMDKSAAKKIMTAAGIPTPAYKEFDLSSVDNRKLSEMEETIELPCVVKVVNGGSSIGVYICDESSQVHEALKECAERHARIIVEQKITGREFTVPVLDGKAISPIEIIPPEGGSFDYVAKYQSGSEGAREICPADITPDEEVLLKTLALRFHEALGLAVYSRTDFILDKNGEAWCLEVNTLPGMTPNSLIPRAARLEGLDYARLCERIVELSMKEKRG